MIHIKKFHILIYTCLISSFAHAQTAIGIREVTNSNVILDFKPNDNRGIILPWVISENAVNTPAGGTLIFDSNDKKIKYYKAGNVARWEDLSKKSGAVNTSIQNGLEETNNKTIIGEKTTTANGVLVLESNNKAMVLPTSVSPHLSVKNPVPGTMVFDSESKMLCLFNGSEWSFWKVEK